MKKKINVYMMLLAVPGILITLLLLSLVYYNNFRDQVIYPQEACQELVRNREGEAAYWWLRTASPDVSESEGMAYFNRTGPNGDPFHFATASTDFSGVMFGFCV